VNGARKASGGEGTEATMSNEVMPAVSAADAIESGSEMLRALREELAANDVSALLAPVNDDAFISEPFDADALCAADPEFAAVCDERRDGWLARVLDEDNTCDE
jgi:hypothetical protein